ncbi:MAG TPA: FG-GAP-like repeat-containing protein [Kofleriaceae bacterium]|nr:FG-GAP-like repeat-containing protein [Kofleriaceae bacterium]
MKLFALAGLSLAFSLSPAWGQATITCPQTSGPTAWSGGTLDTGTTKNGVVYNGTSSALQLQPAAGLFQSTTLGISDLTVFASSADFNKDGWDDFVGTGEAHAFVNVYVNHTIDNEGGADWSNPSYVATPKFTVGRVLVADSLVTKWRPIIAGDFNGDGWPDIFEAEGDQYAQPSVARVWLNSKTNDASGNPQFGAAYSAMAAGSTPSQLGYQNWGGTNIQAVDWNQDGRLDILVGSGSDNGTVRIFTNNCTLKSPLPSPLPNPPLLPCQNSPTFVYSGALIMNLGFGSTSTQGNLAVFTYKDFDGDGFRDLIVGAPDCCAGATTRLRVWKGISGNTLEATSSQNISFVGAATSLLAADFSLDGKLDMIATTDNWNYGFTGGTSGTDGIGGIAEYYVNNKSSAPFSSGVTQHLTTHNNPTYDYDVGFVFDYDNDPNHTPDVMVADGNHTASFYVLANRVVNQYVACGDVASGVIDLGALSNSEMVVTSARLHPTMSLNGGTVSWYMTNETPPNWVTATDCGDGTGDVCATFPKPVGKSVQWKATMCSNSTHTLTPSITNVTVKYSYTLAAQHYQAGVIINDGIAYVGAFTQPGNRGKFYAVNAALSTNYWEAGAKLDATADSTRNLFTANPASNTLMQFTVSNATNLIPTLQATDSTQATSVINWVRSARFGVGNAGITPTRLGAVVSSTPAILTPPSRPLWYAFSAPSDRARVEAFISANTTRVPLVLVGAMDGIVHAFYTISSNIADSRNGNEAWGYIPPKIAAGMVADYTASLPGTTTVASFPDGSPTLADIKKADGTTATIAVVASGNGGKSIATFDVTSTVNPSTGAVSGPKPLWSAVPGNSLAGQAQLKPAVARVLIAGQEKYQVIAATGIATDNAAPPWNEGRIIAAYDAETGYQYWTFRALCPITSDITVFETDDAAESGNPTINGYADRVVFADYCGYVYKLDPARDLAGATNGNTGMGTQLVDTVSGVNEYALFSTQSTTGALAQQSPIAGTIAARTDSSTRMVLFFGTGGLASWPATKQNQFYAVFADTGAIRSKITGACSGGSCEKFYGGVVVTPSQVLLTRTIDPKIATGTCDLGSSNVEALKLDADASNNFVVDFNVAVASAVMGGLYGDRGAVYFADLNGDVNRIGTPLAANAGDDSAHGYNPGNGSGTGSGTGSGIVTGTTSAFTLMGWRQVF